MSRTMTIGLGAALAAVLLGLPAAYAAPPATAGSTGQGQALMDSRGMTLYTTDRDTPGKSTCNGQCAQNWPPLAAAADAAPTAEWTVVTRDDGSRQWAYNGKPVYAWSKDAKPGDTTGEGVANVWHIARP